MVAAERRQHGGQRTKCGAAPGDHGQPDHHTQPGGRDVEDLPRRAALEPRCHRPRVSPTAPHSPHAGWHAQCQRDAAADPPATVSPQHVPAVRLLRSEVRSGATSRGLARGRAGDRRCRPPAYRPNGQPGQSVASAPLWLSGTSTGARGEHARAAATTAGSAPEKATTSSSVEWALLCKLVQGPPQTTIPRRGRARSAGREATESGHLDRPRHSGPDPDSRYFPAHVGARRRSRRRAAAVEQPPRAAVKQPSEREGGPCGSARSARSSARRA